MNLGGDSNAEISFTIGQKNKKQILTKRGEVKMKILKRIAAMGAAVMMMASISSMGVSAKTTNVSFYISTSGAQTQASFTGSADINKYYSTNFCYNKYSSKNVRIYDKSYLVKGKKWILIIDGVENNFQGYQNRHQSRNSNIVKGNTVINKLSFSPGKATSGSASGSFAYN